MITENYFSVTVDMDTLAEDLAAEGLEERKAEFRRVSYEKVLPRLVEILDKAGIRATFFAVASHLEDPSCASQAGRLALGGHEIASHGWSHDRNLPVRGFAEIKKELSLSAEAIKRVTGLRPAGFRSPGAVAVPELFKALEETGYSYDSSYNPSFIYNFSKKIYSVLNGKGLPAQKKLPEAGRDEIFRAGKLIEFPVTLSGFMTLPLMNFFMMKFGRLGLGIIDAAAGKKKFLNYIIHDHELLDAGDFARPGEIAGMTGKYLKTPLSDRLEFIASALKLMGSRGKFSTLREISYNFRG